MKKDTDIQQRERQLSMKLKLPVQAWNPIADYGKDYLYIGGSSDGIQIYNYLGVSGKVDSIAATEDRTSVHLYKNTYLDKLNVTNGEHTIAEGAYVSFFNAEGDAVVYVQGHVNNMYIAGTAQVFLQAGAYVDSLNCGDGGFVRVEKGAAVHGLVILKDGKAEISTMADIYDKVIKEGAIVSHIPDDSVYPMKIRLYFDDLEKRDAFCKQVTEEVRTKNGVNIDKGLTLWGVCNCYVLPNDKGWNVYLSSSTPGTEDRSVIEERIGKRFDVKDVEVWLNGVSTADLKRQKETAMAAEYNRKYQEYEKLKRQLDQMRSELYPTAGDADTHVHFFCRN